MEVPEDVSVDYCEVNSEASPKMQAEPSDYHSISSSNRQNNSALSLILDEFHSKKERNYGSMNLDELLNNFWDTEGNQDTPTKEGQDLSYGTENGMGDDQIFEQVTTKENEISNSAPDVSEPANSGRRRRSSSPASSQETVMEKRQRRMIKNRESAARSRARKQAYTAELEIELNRLREENDKLKLLVAQVAKEEVEKKKQPKKLNGWLTN